MNRIQKLFIVPILILIPSLAFGVVAKDADSSSSGSGTTNITWSHTVTGSNTVLVCLAAISLGGVVSAYTFNGVNLTLKGIRDNGVSYPEQRIEMWFLIAPAAGAHTVSLTTVSSADRIVGGCTSFTGADQVTPLGAAVTNTPDGDVESTPITITVPTNGMAYGGVAFGNSDAACPGVTPNSAGMTTAFNTCVGSAFDNVTGASATRTTTGNYSWINLAGAYAAMIAVPISVPTGGGGGSVRRRVVVVQ